MYSKLETLEYKLYLEKHCQTINLKDDYNFKLKYIIILNLFT